MTIPAIILAALLHILPPCQSEDSTNCAWSAQEQGNGLGQSFASVGPVTFY